MEYLQFVVGILNTNCYLLFSEDKSECILIDCGDNFEEILTTTKKHSANLKAIVLTHGHFDHIGGLSEAVKHDIPIYISEKDKDFLTESKLNLSTDFGYDFALTGGNIITFGQGELDIGKIKLTVIETPGHTKGSCCFICGDLLFSGDTLFKNSYGAYTFKTGSYKDIKNSLNDLFTLDKDYLVLPGHGETTSLFYEKINNPILI